MALSIVLSVDAAVNDADNVESIVFNMFSVRQVIAKEIVIISPTSTKTETAPILSKNEFHDLAVCEGELLVRIVTTKDLIKCFLEQQSESK